MLGPSASSEDVSGSAAMTAGDQPPSEHHENQLRLYAEAARVLGMNPVRLAIHNLDVKDGGRSLPGLRLCPTMQLAVESTLAS